MRPAVAQGKGMKFPIAFLLLMTACGPAREPGVVEPDPRLGDVFRTGTLTPDLKPRVSGAGLRVHRQGSTTFSLLVSRDETGRVWKQLEARGDDGGGWTHREAVGERFTDFTVHPSGEVTLGVERTTASSDRFDLVRLDASGAVLHRQVLARPSGLPAGAPVFRMHGVVDGSVVTGWLPWLTLTARGEDLVIGLLSYLDDGLPPEDGKVASAVLSVGWRDGAFVQDWARVVDGAHALIMVAWQYDEFLWLDAASRLLVSLDEDGTVVVGRSLGSSRCTSLVTFGEATAADCRLVRSFNSPHRYQPFAFTTFTADGDRVGTRILAPPSFEEFVVFDMVAREGNVAVAGTVVRLSADGAPTYYFEEGSSTELSPYDGYLAVVSRANGAVVFERFVDQGRGEFLATLAWTKEGLVAGGARDWNRWSGGMSLSRGAAPLLVFAPFQEGVMHTRTLAVDNAERHFYVRSLDVEAGVVVAAGPADAPMTHSGDAAVAPMAMGGLTLRLE